MGLQLHHRPPLWEASVPTGTLQRRPALRAEPFVVLAVEVGPLTATAPLVRIGAAMMLCVRDLLAGHNANLRWMTIGSR